MKEAVVFIRRKEAVSRNLLIYYILYGQIPCVYVFLFTMLLKVSSHHIWIVPRSDGYCMFHLCSCVCCLRCICATPELGRWITDPTP
ncbi:hypothetical protein MtrunA17_Chr7g0253931 [Medicago truncatula]|uniref:Transmembrane protein n=1 Tax=Medicago truncatula TaxID=3880 RepID=A0A396H8M3_MEDTR|nr:hypothetical protein MtrunA17_Chr7g0253931 [Medicago truncatula]